MLSHISEHSIGNEQNINEIKIQAIQGETINRAMTNKPSWECFIGFYLHVQGLAVFYSSFNVFIFKLLALRTLNKSKYSIIEYVKKKKKRERGT